MIPILRIFSIRRLVNAFRYSCDGFRAVLKEDDAFRLEAVLCIVLAPITFFLHVSVLEKIMLVSSLLLVLIVELLNTAIETTINRISTEIHPLSKKAKDVGSAAVLLSLVFACLVWGGILLG